LRYTRGNSSLAHALSEALASEERKADNDDDDEMRVEGKEKAATIDAPDGDDEFEIKVSACSLICARS
jgi:hypothetical protein